MIEIQWNTMLRLVEIEYNHIVYLSQMMKDELISNIFSYKCFAH